jgi:hypothetical protein
VVVGVVYAGRQDRTAGRTWHTERVRLPRAYAARALVVLGCWLGRDGEVLALEPGPPFDEYVHAAWPSVAHASELRSLVVARDGHRRPHGPGARLISSGHAERV